MAKKKSGKVVQLLTPENYIRKKSHDLPVFECTVNSDWKESGMAAEYLLNNDNNTL